MTTSTLSAEQGDSKQPPEIDGQSSSGDPQTYRTGGTKNGPTKLSDGSLTVKVPAGGTGQYRIELFLEAGNSALSLKRQKVRQNMDGRSDRRPWPTSRA